jgi:hypothetical protein
MSFKVFIYYCAICGGWAALAAWALAFLAGLTREDVNSYTSSTLTGGLLGLLLAAIIGFLDSLLNSVGSQRIVRVLVALAVGLGGGLIGGVIGEALKKGVEEALKQEIGLLRVVGWMLVGSAIGASIGVYDLLRALALRQTSRQAVRKIVNGLIGGVLGGLAGGFLFQLPDVNLLPRTALAIGFVVLGLCIGLLIGLAQVILKEAWLRVESGFRPGRELIVSKSETTIGRAESCDIGLFGDPTIDKVHARVVLQGHRYLLADGITQSGTFLNEQRIAQPTPLRSGDTIRVGNSVIRFRERQKRR